MSKLKIVTAIFVLTNFNSMIFQFQIVIFMLKFDFYLD